MVSSFCSSSRTLLVNLVTNPVIRHAWGKDREVLTTSGTYSQSFVTKILQCLKGERLWNLQKWLNKHIPTMYCLPKLRNDWPFRGTSVQTLFLIVWVDDAPSVVFFIVLCRLLFVFLSCCPLLFWHFIVFTPIDTFWLLLCYLQTFLAQAIFQRSNQVSEILRTDNTENVRRCSD